MRGRTPHSLPAEMLGPAAEGEGLPRDSNVLCVGIHNGPAAADERNSAAPILPWCPTDASRNWRGAARGSVWVPPRSAGAGRLRSPVQLGGQTQPTTEPKQLQSTAGNHSTIVCTTGKAYHTTRRMIGSWKILRRRVETASREGNREGARRRPFIRS